MSIGETNQSDDCFDKNSNDLFLNELNISGVVAD